MTSFSKENILLQLLVGLFIFLFVYTAVSKFLDFRSFQLSLHASSLISDNNILIAWAIPLGELVTAALLFVPRTRLPGLYSFFVLMTLFTLYLGYMLAFVPNRPCVCGGIIKSMTWTQHLFFNISFTLLSALGIRIHKGLDRTSLRNH